MEQCVYPDCRNSCRTRGLCHGHYQTMRLRVRNANAAGEGEQLEADLLRRGLILPMAGHQKRLCGDELGAFRLGSKVKGDGNG